MKILITAPSLETSKNVSGISTVVNTIIDNNVNYQYRHYLLGRPDNTNTLTYLFVFIRQLVLFPIILRREKIYLVHQNLPFDPKGLMRESVVNFWCYLFKVPVVLHIHGGAFLMEENPKKIWRFLSRILFKHSRQVLVLSEIEREALSKFHFFDSAIVLSNSIAVSDYLYATRPTKHDHPTLLFLGRLHESKGLDDIYEAFCLLKKQSLSFRFVLCGSGPLMESAKDKFGKLLGSDFDFRGVVSGDDKNAAFRDSDFFLLPSRYGEGLPMALLESMASGLIPIVTDDASMKFLVHHGQNGIRVEKRNGRDIAEKISTLLSLDKEYLAQLRLSAVQTVVESYDIKAYVKKLNMIYAGDLTI